MTDFKWYKAIKGKNVNTEDASAVMASMLDGNKVIKMHTVVEELSLAA